MKYKAFIFDLDGTLLDTLEDIVNAVNFALQNNGYSKRYSYEEGKSLIGDGAYVLSKRAFSFKGAKEKDFANFRKDFFDAYKSYQGRTTKPFEGINDLLHLLKEKGFYVCVSSNKPHEFLKLILEDKFPDIKFDEVEGHKRENKEKPDPITVNLIKNNLQLNDEECLYIGDSHVDIETAKNANIDVCLVTYGYDKYTNDLKEKATYVASSTNDIIKLFL